ncbi:MAG: hypothetical protein LLG42_01145 [Chloroflexi bacterium]|nr:hypothetical protein [Chloroflexota bacterium]
MSPSINEIQFDVEDPRGYRIICSKEQWFDHIMLRHQSEGIDEWIDEIAHAIRDPFCICSDADYEDREAYYFLDHDNTKKYLKVVVVITNEITREFITTFFTDSGKKGEKIIWPSSD